MSTTESDFINLIMDINEYLQEHDALNATCEDILRRAEATKKMRELQDSVDADISEGSVQSLIRAKEKVNTLLDDIIRRALESAV